MGIDDPHVREWRAGHRHEVVSGEFAAAFFAYLDTLPWTASRLRWARIPGTPVPFGAGDPQPAWVERFAHTPLSRHDFLMVAYAPAQQALVARTPEVLADIDLLYAASPGARYFCGADLTPDGLSLAVEDFAEFSDSGVKVHGRQARDITDRFREAGLVVGGPFGDGDRPTATEAFHVTAHIDVVPRARVPKREDGALRRAQDLWLAVAREHGVVSPDGSFLVSAGMKGGWLHAEFTDRTDLSRLADPDGYIEFLARSPDGTRLCALSTEGDEHWVIDQAYPPAHEEHD